MGTPMKAPWKEPLRIAGDIGVAGNAVWEVVDADGAQVADVLIVDAEALVHRANAYPALVEALEKAADDIEMAAARRAYAAGLGASEWESCLQTWEGEALKSIRAALAATKEGESDG